MHRTPRRCFLLPECGQASPDRRRSGLPWSLIGGSVPDRRRLRASLVADQLQRSPIGVHVLQISGAMPGSGQPHPVT